MKKSIRGWEKGRSRMSRKAGLGECTCACMYTALRVAIGFGRPTGIDDAA